jgi:tetratricopeptide (TPR) repeat protein
MRRETAVGTLLIILSAFLAWIDVPIRGDVSGRGVGGTALLIGAIAGIAWFYRSYRVSAACGAAGAALCCGLLFNLALRNPFFWSLVDENAQYAGIVAFSVRFLPPNLGLPPDFSKNLFTESLIDRLMTAFYFMGWGWKIAMIGSLLLLGCSLKAGGRENLRWGGIAALGSLLLPGVILLNGLAAENQKMQGDLSMTSGRYAEAIQRYESAQRLSPQWAESDQIHLRLGEAYESLGRSSLPNVRFYSGNRYGEQDHFQEALSEYLLAMQEASLPLREVLLRRIAWTYLGLGLAEYRNGNREQAIAHWEKGIAFDPAQLQAAYFLSRAYFDQGRYEQSIAMGRLVLSQSRNPLLNANVQANIGDSYWKLNDFENARLAYEMSKRLDDHGNLRIFKSLGGT